AYLRVEGVMYSTARQHTRNSLIFFYPQGNKLLAPVPGCIQYIYSTGNSAKFAVKHQLRAPDGTKNPFDKWKVDYPAAIYSRSLASELEDVGTEDIYCHFARCPLSAELVIVLPLVQV
ncbi:hypothetical protein OE88DRAFT_1603655, partial [Heliocybe sulcata]